jgi:hypothetical protein
LDPAATVVAAVVRNGTKFSYWHREDFCGLGVQDFESLIMVGALFPLNGGRRRAGKKKEKKKKIAMVKEGFPEDGLTFLAVQQVAAVRCN